MISMGGGDSKYLLYRFIKSAPSRVIKWSMRAKKLYEASSLWFRAPLGVGGALFWSYREITLIIAEDQSNPDHGREYFYQGFIAA